MESLQHIPLDEILLMSFRAADEGESELADKLYESFLSTKDKAIKLAEKASINGDIDTVEIISKSFEKAKLVSINRSKQKEEISSILNDKNKVKFNENFGSLSLINDDKNIILDNSDNVKDLAKSIIMDFQKSKTSKKESKKIKEAKNYNLEGISFTNQKFNTDSLLAKYFDEKNFDAAIKRANKLLSKDKNSAYLYNYLGACLVLQKKFFDAEVAFKKSIEIEDNKCEAEFNLAKLQIRQGNFSEGWEAYEIGLNNNIRKVFNNFTYNSNEIWDGKPFKDFLLVYGEKNLNDQIIFSTLIDDLINVQKNVVLVIDDKLKKLFQRNYPEIKVFGYSDDLSNVEYSKHIALGSLCKFYRTSIENYESTLNQNFKTNQEIDEQIKFLFPKTNGLKIGISWMDFKKIKKKSYGLSNDEVSQIIKYGDHTFISLQQGNISETLTKVNQKSGNNIHHIPGINFNDNVDSYASVINNCDLIISIDNITAHLAARLGKPVWLLLDNLSDFKWLENSEDSIWYKNVLLLRKGNENDWSKIISYINSALK